MNTSAREVTEKMNTQGQRERIVNTVDYQSSAGEALEQKAVQVVHQPHSPTADSSSSGGVLAGAAAAVASALQSAEEAISGK